MGTLGPMEIFLIFLVILLVFGAKRIPEIARGLGKGIREFKSATSEIASEFNTEERGGRIDQPRRPAQRTQPRTDASTEPQEEPVTPRQEPKAEGEEPRHEREQANG